MYTSYLWRLFIVLLMTTDVVAQNAVIVVGTIEDGKFNMLSDAAVRIDSLPYIFTNEEGKVILPQLSHGTHQLHVSHIGFEPYNNTFVAPCAELQAVLSPISLQVVEISATRGPSLLLANETVIEQKNSLIHQRNVGQDLPFLLQNNTSVVVTSDAGTGIGYTSLRVRGTDATRINTTINDIPLNDPESHQVYWVDIPDIVATTNSLQIQRGAGSSTNGAGAFGASINLQTHAEEPTPYLQLDHALGAFGSQRHSLSLGTGTQEKWSGDARLGYISSDGYIDRASARLLSYHSQIRYMDTKNLLRIMAFGGQERTYQAWAGVPQEILDTNRTYNPYTYANQVDNYRQHHYQMHYSRYWNRYWTSKISGHYTKGKGFYEQYEIDQTLANYHIYNTQFLNVPDSTLATNSDLVTRKWLNNDFYGTNAALQYQNKRTQLIANVAWNRYEGKHFGEVIWAMLAPNSLPNQHYYDGFGNKTETNAFVKIQHQWTPKIGLFADLQARRLRYRIDGTTDLQQELDYHLHYFFVNPKAGIAYYLRPTDQISLQYSRAQREPTRSNIVDNDELPSSETLHDWELGYVRKQTQYRLIVNAYYMYYRNQLVLTGNLNDVGAPIQQNVEHSYRAGVEVSTNWQINKHLSWAANATYSHNKIKTFDLHTSVFTPEWDYVKDTSLTYQNTDIAFSPRLIASSQWNIQPFRNNSIQLLTKYVGRQFIDNTQSIDRQLSAYTTTDLVVSQQWQPTWCRQLSLTVQVNNIFNAHYESNAWTYFILFEQNNQISPTNYNNYYPQAGTNVFVKLSCYLR